jgi:hypothetical protein
MDGNEDHDVEGDKRSSKNQILHVFYSYVESRPKIMMVIMIMGHV